MKIQLKKCIFGANKACATVFLQNFCECSRCPCENSIEVNFPRTLVPAEGAGGGGEGGGGAEGAGAGVGARVGAEPRFPRARG